MELKEILIKKIPEDLQDKIKFKKLIKLVDENKINDLNTLKEFLNEKVNSYWKWLAENKSSSTITYLRRNKTKELELFRYLKELVEKYV